MVPRWVHCAVHSLRVGRGFGPLGSQGPNSHALRRPPEAAAAQRVPHRLALQEQRHVHHRVERPLEALRLRVDLPDDGRVEREGPARTGGLRMVGKGGLLGKDSFKTRGVPPPPREGSPGRGGGTHFCQGQFGSYLRTENRPKAGANSSNEPTQPDPPTALHKASCDPSTLPRGSNL